MSVTRKVDSLLRQRQDFRDSDKKLLLATWHTEGLHLTEQQRQIFMERCSTAESITRARRKLKTKYPSSKEVDEARFNKFRNYKYNGEIY